MQIGPQPRGGVVTPYDDTYVLASLGEANPDDPAAPLSRLVWQLVGDPSDYNESLGPLAATTVLPAVAYYNRVGRNVTRCTLGNYFTDNVLGNNNDSNTFGADFTRNRTGIYNTDLVFGTNCSYNILGANVTTVRAGNSCTGNRLEDSVIRVTLEDGVKRCTIGLGCDTVSLGAGCERIELYNCQGTIDDPFTIPAGSKDQIWRNNVLQTSGGSGTPGTGGGTSGDVRDLGDVPTAKALAVIAAYQAAGGPVEETDPLYFGQEFIDDQSEPGNVFEYRCRLWRPATGSPVRIWKWGRYLEAGV